MERDRILAVLRETRAKLTPETWLQKEFFDYEWTVVSEDDWSVERGPVCKACVMGWASLEMGHHPSRVENADESDLAFHDMRAIGDVLLPFALQIDTAPTHPFDNPNCRPFSSWERVAEWNDKEHRTLDQVRSMLDMAIASLEAPQEIAA